MRNRASVDTVYDDNLMYTCVGISFRFYIRLFVSIFKSSMMLIVLKHSVHIQVIIHKHTHTPLQTHLTDNVKLSNSSSSF